MADTSRLIRTVTLPLASGTDASTVKDLAKPEGITDIIVSGASLTVTYDLRHADIPAVERWLKANGLPLSSGLFQRFSRWLAAFKDENRKDQAAIVHQCCSVPPKGD